MHTGHQRYVVISYYSIPKDIVIFISFKLKIALLNGEKIL